MKNGPMRSLYVSKVSIFINIEEYLLQFNNENVKNISFSFVSFLLWVNDTYIEFLLDFLSNCIGFKKR